VRPPRVMTLLTLVFSLRLQSKRHPPKAAFHQTNRGSINFDVLVYDKLYVPLPCYDHDDQISPFGSPRFVRLFAVH